ncbi:MAG: hypothetical protein V1838_03635 [Patescibacteria group bacterium]
MNAVTITKTAAISLAVLLLMAVGVAVFLRDSGENSNTIVDSFSENGEYEQFEEFDWSQRQPRLNQFNSGEIDKDRIEQMCERFGSGTMPDPPAGSLSNDRSPPAGTGGFTAMREVLSEICADGVVTDEEAEYLQRLLSN